MHSSPSRGWRARRLGGRRRDWRRGCRRRLFPPNRTTSSRRSRCAGSRASSRRCSSWARSWLRSPRYQRRPCRAASVMSRRGAVLIVDDDETTLDATLAVLTTNGYKAVGANSGRTALALLRDRAVRPRLILLDLNMPGIDGWRFRTELLCDPDLAPIPVVVISAAGGPVV